MRAIIKMASLAAVVFTAVSAHSVDISKDQAMAIARNGEQAPMMGAPANFVGNARIDPLFAARAIHSLCGRCDFPAGRAIGRSWIRFVSFAHCGMCFTGRIGDYCRQGYSPNG